MTTTTANMHLTKPDLSDLADIRVLNSDLDALDGHTHGAGSGVPAAVIGGSSTSGVSLPSAPPVAGQVLTATSATAAAWQTPGSGVGAGVGSPTTLAINGGLEIWQRGTSFASLVSGAYGPDRWQVGLGSGSSMACVQDSTHQDLGSRFCAAWTYSHSGVSSVSQKIENNLEFAGRTISLRLRVRCGTVAAVRAFISPDGGTTRSYSTYHSGSGAYESLDVVAYAVPTSVSSLQVGIEFGASCTAYQDNVMLVVGSLATDYIPLTPGEDLARCQRYYEVQGAGSQTYGITNGYTATGNPRGSTYNWLATKPSSPSVTVVGTWQTQYASQPGINGVSARGVSIYTTPTTSNVECWCVTSGAGTYLTAEVNP